ncbi:hypothetical protein PR048_033642 [Dryococelus australis]|uniref:Uncharacterized protein n=1 Tax=Dryococelus australis TaxID=614101 RepID=A0ABQ9G1R5_9NEOP|nr:hypothetical protein PR048_033642 [Dryococelus australis]
MFEGYVTRALGWRGHSMVRMCPYSEFGERQCDFVKNNAHSTENRIDFKKYNLSPNGCCVFATINQLGLYSRSNVSALVESFNRASRNGVVSQQTTAPMPSNEKVSHQSGDGPDQGNFKTTLVLHLKEKEHMPRHQQKSEALIGFSSHVQGLKSQDGYVRPWFDLHMPYHLYVQGSGLICSFYISNSPQCLRLAIADLDPFTVTSSASGLSVVNGHSPVHEGDHALWQTDAIIQQDGHTLARKDSVYNRLQEKKHGALIPGPVVVKPDNTAAKQKDAKKKQQLSPKFIENCCNGKSTRHSSKQPGVIQRSESFMYSSGPLVELSGGGSPGAERRSRDNVCKSEYVFSEVEAPGETEPSPSRRCCNGNDAEQGMRSREGKLKTSLSQDSRLDLVGDVWPSIPESGQTWSKCAKPGSSRRQERLGSGSESLEIVGERVMTSQQQPYTGESGLYRVV